MYDFIVRYILPIFMPLGILSILIIAALFTLKKNPNKAIGSLVSAILLVLLFGNSFFAAFLTRSMEWRHMPPTSAPKADAILLLSDGLKPAVTPRQFIEVEDAADRVTAAARLFKAGAAPSILLAGGAQNARLAKQALIERGIPEAAIFVQGKQVSTAQDVKLSAVLASEHKIKQIILVTSADKMDRMVFLYKQEKFQIIPFPVDYRVSLEDWTHYSKAGLPEILLNLVPQADAFQQSSEILREYLAILVYRIASIF